MKKENIKFSVRVTPEESRQIQEAGIPKGLDWVRDEGVVKRFADNRYLTVGYRGDIGFGWASRIGGMTEVTVPEALAMIASIDGTDSPAKAPEKEMTDQEKTFLESAEKIRGNDGECTNAGSYVNCADCPIWSNQGCSNEISTTNRLKWVVAYIEEHEGTSAEAIPVVEPRDPFVALLPTRSVEAPVEDLLKSVRSHMKNLATMRKSIPVELLNEYNFYVLLLENREQSEEIGARILEEASL
jgi:hypothetical protein